MSARSVKNVFITKSTKYASSRRADIINYVPTEGLSLCRAHVNKREFGIIILCNKPAFINDVNIE